jgi:integrase
MNAADLGEPFDPVTHLPESWLTGETVYAFAKVWLASEWPSLRAKTRGNILEQTIWALMELTDTPVPPERADVMREWLRKTLRPVDRKNPLPPMPSDARRALDWLNIHSLPLRSVTRARCVDAFTAAWKNLDGTEATNEMFRKRRAGVTRLLNAAVAEDRLAASPAAGIRIRKKTDANRKLSRSEIPTAAEALTLIRTCGKRSPQAERLVAYLAVTLYAGLRPGEANGLRRVDVDLPEEGWGEVRVQLSRTITSKALTDDGRTTAEGLTKTGSSRVVPLHPDAVKLVRRHIERWPSALHDPIFLNSKGGPLNGNIDRVLAAAKAELGWVPPHPLAGTHHYSLRHTAASVAISAGLPLPEVAARLGNSVEELMRTYWHVINVDEAAMNRMLETAYRRRPRAGTTSPKATARKASTKRS